MKIIRHLFAVGLTLSFLLGSSVAHAQAGASGAVHGWEGTINLPTYQIGATDPNPQFPLISRAHVYPYTMLDDLTDHRVNQTYRAIYLENQYLKITILPEVGGHIYSIFDKVNHREVLYRDHVIKYGLVGPRGAWISGGMEFSFPFAHTMDTVSPVESVLQHHADGSATAVIGAIDWISNMHWEIALTLRPDTARVEEQVTLFNSTPAQHLYLFWTNAAVKATDDMQYIYPMRETIDDDPFAVVQSWPVWKGVDQSWYKNNANAIAIFARDSQRNFFGVYYHASDYGVVHVADFRQDPGKKIWSWGTAPSGKIWDHILSDHDGPYNEIQSGRFYTQGYREFMNPRRVETWTEYWFPVQGLKDGFVEATRQMAINANYRTGPTGQQEVQILISPVAEVQNATLTVTTGTQLLKRFSSVHLVPLQPASFVVPVSDLADARKNLGVEIQSAQGKTLLHWSAAEPLDGNPDLVPSVGHALAKPIPDGPTTPLQDLYLHGFFLQKTSNLLGALRVYDEVLQRDPGYIPALVQEAWIQYRAANFQQANALIDRALQRNNQDPSATYAAGVIDRAQNRLSRAKNELWTSIHYSGPLAPAFVELGEIELQQGHTAKAVELLQRAVGYNPGDAFARADLAVAERLHGESKPAAMTASAAVREMPLLPYALAEQAQNTGNADSSEWTKIIGSDPQNYLAIAAWYHELGAWQSSDHILHAAEKLPVAERSPMIEYYLASNARQQGNHAQAQQYAQKAATMDATEVFPNRLSDVVVRRGVTVYNPADAHAKYALGNFLFAHDRYQAADDLWVQAQAEGFHNAVLLRNLGLYEWRIQKNLASAAKFYSDAIQLNPQDYRLYNDLDSIYEEQEDSSARAKLFRDAPPSVLQKDTVVAHHALFEIEQSHDDEALAILMGHNFKPWEGGVLVRNFFAVANLQNGKTALADHHAVEAEKAFRLSMEYPENLGTGKPNQPIQSEQFYWLGVALQAQGKTADAQAAWKTAAAQASEQTTPSAVYAALAYRKLGQTAAADKVLTRCSQAAQKPNAVASDYYTAGLAEKYRGDAPAAKASFLQALNLDPSDWQARMALTQQVDSR